jgi:hypothetical protein
MKGDRKVEEEVIKEETQKILEDKKAKIKKIVIAIVIIAVIIAIISGIVNAVKPTPEKTVKKFIEAIGKGKIEDAYKLVDLKGAYVFDDLYDYEDFKDEYKDIEDDWEDFLQEDLEERKEDFIEEFQDEIGDLEDFSVEIKTKKLKSKKVKGSGILYTVKAKIKITYKEDGESAERETGDYVFYVMNKDNKYYVVGVTSSNGEFFTDLIYEMIDI